ncbi:Type I Iterative PKS [Glutinoglossum americanum]|uniref:Type I Iterative PKS n=1 Tax=Glutinoglossum americanum TaxID=1670608 RepID=A0A9P8L2R9_9PEZI|nr:Type I Iterative PKS [Glutinoglossum americanum]
MAICDSFWDLLANKKDGQCCAPEDHYTADAFCTETNKYETRYFHQDTDLQHLDTSFFFMSRVEAERLDLQQRLLLEVVWDCLENAGQAKWRGENIGCYVGAFGENWLDLRAKDTQEALYASECSSAIAGGTDLIISPAMAIAMHEQGILLATGSCKSFDARAGGYARGEAVNALYIKRSDQAIRDGDPICAVIRATATNCDGKTPSQSHEAPIRRAYRIAGFRDFSKTALVECHGTATPTGDTLETQAVANVFGKSGVFIGSVKPNVGHPEGAPGITSVIRAVLALESKMGGCNSEVLTLQPAVSDSIVNSFGIEGANAHAILDSAASLTPCSNASRFWKGSSRSYLLVFSANRPDSLRKLVDNYQAYIKQNTASSGDMAYTLAARRGHLQHPALCVTNGGQPLDLSPFTKPGAPTGVAFVFTGQGAQWAQMGMELMEECPAFRGDIKAMDDILAELSPPPGWTIEDELLKGQTSSRLHKAEFSQPLCTAVQVALVNLLRTWGVLPTAVIGHSSGEIAAAYACNAITLAEGIIIAYYRGQVTKECLQAGGMAAVGLSREEVLPYLVEGVVVACENSPSSVTLSGDKQPLDTIVAQLKEEQPETFVGRLHVDMAYHSHHMKSCGELYESLLANHITSSRPSLPFYSSVTGCQVNGPNPLGSNYWRQNLESPVLFKSAVETLLNESPQGAMLFIEVGPNPALAGPLRQIFKTAKIENASHIPTMVRGSDSVECLLKTAGQLYLQGVPLHFPAITPGGAVLTNLPCYPRHHDKQYWNESRMARDQRLRKSLRHGILGSRVLEGTDLNPTWRNMLCLEDAPWIRDHVVLDDVVFPAAGYIGMVGEAVRQLTGSHDYTMRHVVIKTSLVLLESKATEMITNLSPVRLTDSLDSAWYNFSISSSNGATWTKRCFGQAREGPTHAPTDGDVKPDIGTLIREVQPEKWYQTTKRVGLNYGPTFVGLTRTSTDVKNQTAVGTIPNGMATEDAAYQIHPVAMDQCLQLFSIAAAKGLPRLVDKLYMPTYIDELYIRRTSSTIRAKATVSPTPGGSATGGATAVSEGEVVFRLKGLKLSPLDRGTDSTEGDTDPHGAAELDWKPDIDFVSPRDLIRPRKNAKGLYLLLEKLALLCMIEARQRLSFRHPGSDHISKYRSWINTQVARAERGEYSLIPDAYKLLALTSQDRRALICVAHSEVQQTDAFAIGDAILRVFNVTESIFDGHTNPLDLLLKDNTLTEVYSFASRGNFRLPTPSQPRETEPQDSRDRGWDRHDDSDCAQRPYISEWRANVFHVYVY